MDKTKGELLQEELLFKQENGTTRLSDNSGIGRKCKVKPPVFGKNLQPCG